jgi:hypothetical protein
MSPEECKYILQDNAAVLLDPVKVDQRSGSLIEYYQSLEAGDAKSLIAFYLGRIYGSQSVATDQYPRSIQFASVEASLPADLQAVSAKLVESAGGRPYSGVTEQDVIDAKAAWEQDDAQFWSLFNQHVAILKDAREVDGWKAAIQSMADGWVE